MGRISFTSLIKYFIAVMLTIGLVLFVVLFRIPSNVEHALEQAGVNRSEMEQVLAHYRFKNLRKYQSACFLIANMPYHKSKETIHLSIEYVQYLDSLNTIYDRLFSSMTTDSILKVTPKHMDELRKSLGQQYNAIRYSEVKANDRSDIHLVKAAFLIDHIDRAFESWEVNPLTKSLKFDEFKEFVLPYRSTNEELIVDRSTLRKQWESILAKDGYGHIELPLKRLKAFVGKCRWLSYFTKPSGHVGIFDLILPKFRMNCHRLTNWSVNILRSCGVPTVYEYTPQWKNRNSKHFWAVSPDSAGIWQPYTAPDNNIRENWESDIIHAGKVYRRTFGINKNTPYFIAGKNEFVPDELNSPLLQDQTWRYHKTITLRLPMHRLLKNKVVYLCMFQGDELNPVAWGRIDSTKQEAVFEQVPFNTVFIPVYYNENEEQVLISEAFKIDDKGLSSIISEPLTQNVHDVIFDFTLKNNQLIDNDWWSDRSAQLGYHPIIPNGSFIDEMLIIRKYPEKEHLKAMQRGLKGSFFVGIENNKKDTLVFLDKSPIPYWQEVDLRNNHSYSVYRFYAAGGKPIHMAELEFLGPKDDALQCQRPTPLPIFSPKDTMQYDNRPLYRIAGVPQALGHFPEYVYDGKIETVGGNSRTGMDFGRPVLITHVRFVPRTANNGIVPGQKYTLYYFDGKTWKLHQSQVARYNFLSFRQVPQGTLYWLKNETDGKEELPFFYGNGQQVFMHNKDI